MTRLVLLAQIGSTLYMVGLVWFVQLVHYPLFGGVGEEGFARYEAEHQRLTTWAVGPAMLVELVTAIALFWWRPAGVPLWMVIAGVALVGVVWLSTWLLQVPQHRALQSGFNAEAHRVLVVTNWVRTVAWSLRGVLVLAMVGAIMRYD